MKLTAVLLMALIILLSPFTGIVKSSGLTAKADCCKQMPHKAYCHHGNKQNQTGGCSQPGCSTMPGCSVCVFLPGEFLRIKATDFSYFAKPKIRYKVGRLTAYHAFNFKPPKIV